MTPPLRYTQQLAADQWVTSCAICPKRHAKHIARTQQAVDRWWRDHVTSRGHLAVLERDGAPTPEDVLLAEIFGSAILDRPNHKPTERDGEVLRRKNVRKVRALD